MVNGLHGRTVGEGPDVVLLHGLFGQGSNLGSIARALQNRFTVHSLDLPDHGRSPWTEAASLETYASAVARWLDDRGMASAAVIGHSLGGKVAMMLALQQPQRVSRLVVADIAPVTYRPSHSDVFAGIAAVEAAQCDSRADADRILKPFVSEPAVRQFLLLNLKNPGSPSSRSLEPMAWQFNWQGLREAYSSLLAWPEDTVPCARTNHVLFIRGALSSYIAGEELEAIEKVFPGAVVETLVGAGHWLHAEQPSLFNQLVLNFLPGGQNGVS